MAIVQAGGGVSAGVGTPADSTSGAKAAASKPAPSAVQNSPLGSISPIINDVLAGRNVNPATLPSSSGPNASLINALVGGSAYEASANNAQNQAQALQTAEAQQGINIGAQSSQTQAGLQEQGIALNKQNLALSQTELSQQAALNPQLQAVELGQYGISQAQGKQALAQNTAQQGYEEQQYGLTQQAATGAQAAEVTGYNQQWDASNPNSAYSLANTGIQNTLGNLTQNYNYSLPELASSASASGALNSGQAQTNSAQNTSNYQYQVGQENLSQAQLQNQASQAGTAQAQEVANYNINQQLASLGQQSEVSGYQYGQQQQQETLASSALGQKGEAAQYKYSQQQIADQDKGLQIAGKQLGLSSSQVKTQLSEALQQAGVGGQQLAASLAASAASGDASTIAAIIQAAELGSPAATTITKKK